MHAPCQSRGAVPQPRQMSPSLTWFLALISRAPAPNPIVPRIRALSYLRALRDFHPWCGSRSPTTDSGSRKKHLGRAARQGVDGRRVDAAGGLVFGLVPFLGEQDLERRKLGGDARRGVEVNRHPAGVRPGIRL